MFKVKYIICLIVLSFMNPCFSDGKATLSFGKREHIYNTLSELMTEAQVKKLAEKDQEREIKKKNNGGRHYSDQQKWQVVFDKPGYNTYVKKLFKSTKFSSWIKDNSEPLFFAIQFVNIEMVKFLSERKGSVNRFIERYKDPPLFRAIIAQSIEGIEYFLNHPETDLNAKGFFDNNIFHYIFLGLGKTSNSRKNTKGEITKLLFKERYFSQNSHLLNEPNDIGSTAFDYLLRDPSIIQSEIQQIMDIFLEKGAVPLQLRHIFLEKILKDNIEEIEFKIYKLRGIKEYKDLIISNIRAYIVY